ncbi:MAG: hypothetical protein MZV70_68900 [Desulfobacterales bacterium]|nr:hypothetical protein [Desulfobacterales bacterium]
MRKVLLTQGDRGQLSRKKRSGACWKMLAQCLKKLHESNGHAVYRIR